MTPKTLGNLKALLHSRDMLTIARSRIFDANWYRREYPDCSAEGLTPLVHYVLKGFRQDARPHLLFDPAWYRSQRERMSRDRNPLIDYIRCGAREGIDPSPYFSTRFYTQAAGSLRGLTPLGHFIAYGLPNGAIPTPLFDRTYYLDNNPDVRRAGFDPFLHFAASGSHDGRSPGPLFDAGWYRMKNPEVRDEGCEPLRHYFKTGAARGLNPSPFFDAEFYVARSGAPGVTLENALTDYAEHGYAQWRSTHKVLPPPGSPVAYFEDFPWQWVEQSLRKEVDAPFRVLVVDIENTSQPCAAGQAEIASGLEELPGLDVHVLTNDARAWVGRKVQLLDLSRSDLSFFDQAIALDRVLRSLKFRDVQGFVIESACVILNLAALCKDIGLRHYAIGAAATDSNWRDLLRNKIGYCAAPRPTVSVIIPNYNHANYLDERFRSIFGQSIAPDEIIFLDDSSSDDSLMLAELWRLNSRAPFAIMQNPVNGGSPFKQWAKGIEKSTCDLVWIAESDDACHPGFLERMTAYFIDPSIVLAYSDSQVIGPDGQLLAQTYRFYTDTLDDAKWLSGYVADGVDEIRTALSIKNTIPNVSGVLFRRTALRAAIPPMQKYRYCGDWLTYVECLLEGKVAFCPQALNRHRQEPGGVTKAGELASQAGKEALTIKSAIFQNLVCESRILWLSLAQTVFEYQLRLGPAEPGVSQLLDEGQLAESLMTLIGRLHSPLFSFREFLDPIAEYLTSLAIASPALSKCERTQIITSTLAHLQRLTFTMEAQHSCSRFRPGSR